MAAPAGGSGEPAPQTVLVVDGEVLVRHAIADYLRRCGYVVIEAASSDEALTVIAEAGIAVDAVLCDAAVGGSLNAFELVRRVRSARPGLDVALAGNPASAAASAADLCDSGPHLARPYDPQGVVDYVKRLLAKSGREGR